MMILLYDDLNKAQLITFTFQHLGAALQSMASRREARRREAEVTNQIYL